MTAIIIEDIPQAAAMLQSDLKRLCPEVEVIGVAHSVVSGAKLLQAQQPDILFLDIMLGDGTGFDLLEIMPKLQTNLIFTTASDEHAIRAFRYAAIDYLLKPIDPELLVQAVQRAGKAKGNTAPSLQLLRETMQHPHIAPQRISLHAQERISIVEINQIIRCESDDNNTRFVLATDERLYVTKTLKHYEQMLEQHGFIRVHQSHLVNTAFLKAFDKRDGGMLLLKNGEQVPVSVRKRAEILAYFG
jgi:two-component system, LytTR family, response regulator